MAQNTPKIRIAAPATAQKGDTIELKALIQHKMESGYRLDERGEVIPQKIITLFECLLDDSIIFSANFHRGVAANPFINFHMVATHSGTLRFRWIEETGLVFSKTVDLTVS